MQDERAGDSGSGGAAGEAIDPLVGLCTRCTHARVVRGDRSAFWRCARADEKAPEVHAGGEPAPRFLRYPPLPVLRCPGFEAASRTPGHGRNPEEGSA